MAVESKVVTVATTVTLLSATAETDLQKGHAVLVKNEGPTVVYVGGSAVTADATAGTGGYTLGAGAEVSVQLQPGEELYGRVASGTQVVRVLRQGV